MSPEIVTHLIESAIARHYDKCKRSHSGTHGRSDANGGWFHCEAKAIGRDAAIVAAFALVDAAEQWRIEMRMATPGPCDQRLIAAVEGYRDTINALIGEGGSE